MDGPQAKMLNNLTSKNSDPTLYFTLYIYTLGTKPQNGKRGFWITTLIFADTKNNFDLLRQRSRTKSLLI